MSTDNLKIPAERFDKPKESTPNLTRWIGVVLFIASITIAWLGYTKKLDALLPENLVLDYYANVSTELASIAITILIIDYLNEIREKRSTKARLIRELGSEDNGFALRALVELRANGWLEDGTLTGAHLRRANLYHSKLNDAVLFKAYLRKANISNSYLGDADLQEVDFAYANLESSSFERANLTNAILLGANLKNARFDNANLQGAKVTLEQLSEVASLEGAIMPDGTPSEIWIQRNKLGSSKTPEYTTNESGEETRFSNHQSSDKTLVIFILTTILVLAYRIIKRKQ